MVQNLFTLWQNSKDVPFDVLFREAPILAHSIDADGVILNVSSMWADALGYKPVNMIGRPSVDFLSERSRAYALEHVLPEFFKVGSVVNEPYEFVRSDGTTYPVLMSAASISKNGRFERSLAIMFNNRQSVELAIMKRKLWDIRKTLADMTAGTEPVDRTRIAVMVNSLDTILTD